MDLLTLGQQLEIEELYNEEELELRSILGEDDENFLSILSKISNSNITPGSSSNKFSSNDENKALLKERVKELRKEIPTLFDKKLKRFGVEHINIALMGRMGCSKSTTINGFYQALHENHVTLAKAESSNGTVTKSINPTNLANRSSTSNCPYGFINVLDIFGEDENIYNEEFLHEYFNGRISYSFELGEEAGKKNVIPSDWKKYLRKRESIAHMPHVVLYMNEITLPSAPETISNIKKFFDMIKAQGVPGFGLGTKIDNVANFEEQFFSVEVMKRIKKLKDLFGLNSVYPMSNYTGINHLQSEVKDFMYLYILKRAILQAQEFIYNSREFVEIIDNFSTTERYVTLRSLQISLADFQKELDLSYPNDKYRVELDDKIETENIKLRDRLKAKVGEPFISQIIVHRDIKVTIELDKPRIIEIYPMWTINQFYAELEAYINNNNIKKPKEFVLQDQDLDNKPYLKDYLVKLENEETEYRLNVKPKSK